MDPLLQMTHLNIITATFMFCHPICDCLLCIIDTISTAIVFLLCTYFIQYSRLFPALFLLQAETSQPEEKVAPEVVTPADPKKHAFSTLVMLNEKYVAGALVLAWSIKSCTFPFAPTGYVS